MIKKVARIDAPLDAVQGVFADVLNWPHWMPGIQTAKIVEGSDDQFVAEFKQNQLGRRSTQVMAFRRHAQGIHTRQVSGWFKHWEADWRFLQPPDKKGTTVSFAVQFDLGLLGFFATTRMIQRVVDRIFDDMMTNLERRMQSLSTGGQDQAPETGPEEETVLEVFQTSTGLEVRIDGKKYLLKPAD
jgi:ribosome-associated toxin RatA of RatAB toxin-antitoxin module